jgi:hypothetical protein
MPLFTSPSRIAIGESGHLLLVGLNEEALSKCFGGDQKLASATSERLRWFVLT